MGTPLCIPTKEYIDIGKIASIEINHKQVDTATKGQKVAIKVGAIICITIPRCYSGFCILLLLLLLYIIVCWVCEQIIANNSDEQQRSFGRHFDMEDELVSRISRRSIDILKQNYRASPILPPYFSCVPRKSVPFLIFPLLIIKMQEDLSIEDWKLVVKLKAILKIQ